MHQSPVRFLVLIETSAGMVARLFDAQRRQVNEIDASSEEVAAMTAGLTPARGADDSAWATALAGHNAVERRSAAVYSLPV
jgi:hypothetical protein